jgi:hypothetical protein
MLSAYPAEGLLQYVALLTAFSDKYVLLKRNTAYTWQGQSSKDEMRLSSVFQFGFNTEGFEGSVLTM